MKTKLLSIVLIILFSIPSIIALFKTGFFITDDGDWMLIRFTAFHQAFVDGQFPVRFLGRLNHEYGYLVPNFNYPGFMYLAEIPKILGFGFVDAIKIILGFSMLGSAVFTFLWLSKLFNKFSSTVGALVYLYSPYHIFDLYKRGSVGEVLALSIVPFILWQIERRSLFFTSLSIALLILSHNILATLFIPIIVLYSLLKFRTPASTIYPLLLGLGLSAFFWIPAIYDLQYTVFLETTVSEWGSHFAELNLIGLSTVLILLSAGSFLVLKRNDMKIKRQTTFFLIVGALSIVLATPISKVFWEILPVSFIQFPFRFLSLALIAAVFLAAFLGAISELRTKFLIGITIIVLTFFSGRFYLSSVEHVDKGEGFYATNMHSTTIKNEYMPKWVRVMPEERPEQFVEIVEGAGELKDITFDNREVRFSVSIEDEGTVRINRIYFPGWKAVVNGEEADIVYDNDRGVMDIAVSKGDSNVLITFTETPIRLVSDMLSLSSLGLLVFLVLKRHEKSS